jgi:hypothetical protein
MKGYRFYEEFDSSYKKRKRQGSGNVLALDIDPKTAHPFGWFDGRRYVMRCTAAVFSHANSGIAGTAVSREVLAKNYRRVTEKAARAIHPAMFNFLDQFDENGDLREVAA